SQWREHPRHRVANILLRDIELSKHVLIKRVINITLDPVQSDHALLELFGKLPVDAGSFRGGRVHLGHYRVRASAGFSVVLRANSAAAVRQAFWKKSEVKECKIAEMLVVVPTQLRRCGRAGFCEHLEK